MFVSKQLRYLTRSPAEKTAKTLLGGHFKCSSLVAVDVRGGAEAESLSCQEMLDLYSRLVLRRCLLFVSGQYRETTRTPWMLCLIHSDLKKKYSIFRRILNGMQTKTNVLFVYSCGIMSDKSELKAELERKKQRLAQIREEKKRKEEERKKKEVCLTFCKCFEYLLMLNAKVNVENKQNHQWPSVSPQFKCRFSPHTYFW